MNNPLIILLPLAAILAVPAYLVFRDRRRANEKTSELLSTGFEIHKIYDFHDSKVAIDNTSKRISFINVEVQSRTQYNKNFTAIYTVTEPIENLEQLEVYDSKVSISLTVHFSQPAKFNSKTSFSFSTAAQSRSVVKDLCESWPGKQMAKYTVMSK